MLYNTTILALICGKNIFPIGLKIVLLGLIVYSSSEVENEQAVFSAAFSLVGS